jgi:hypothetical protein
MEARDCGDGSPLRRRVSLMPEGHDKTTRFFEGSLGRIGLFGCGGPHSH